MFLVLSLAVLVWCHDLYLICAEFVFVIRTSGEDPEVLPWMKVRGLLDLICEEFVICI